MIQRSVGRLFFDILGTRLADPLGLVVEDDAERRIDEKDSERLTVRRTDDTVDVEAIARCGQGRGVSSRGQR